MWLYVGLGFLVAISVTFPLFLIAPERRLANVEPGSAGPSLTTADRVALSAFGLVTVASPSGR